MSITINFQSSDKKPIIKSNIYKAEFNTALKKYILYRNDKQRGELVLSNKNALYMTLFKTSKTRSGTIDSANLYLRKASKNLKSESSSIIFPNDSSKLYFVNFNSSNINYRKERIAILEFEEMKKHEKGDILMSFYSSQNHQFYYHNEDKKIQLENITSKLIDKDFCKYLKSKNPYKKYISILNFNSISRRIMKEKLGTSYNKEAFFYYLGTIDEILNDAFLD